MAEKKLEDISVVKFLEMVKSAYDNSERDLNDKNRKDNMSSAGYCRAILLLSDYKKYREDLLDLSNQVNAIDLQSISIVSFIKNIKDIKKSSPGRGMSSGLFSALLSCSEKLKKIEKNYDEIKNKLVTLYSVELEVIVNYFTSVYDLLIKKLEGLVKETNFKSVGLGTIDKIYKTGIKCYNQIKKELEDENKNNGERPNKQYIDDIIKYCAILKSKYDDILNVPNINLEQLEEKATEARKFPLEPSAFNYIMPSDFSICLISLYNACDLAANEILNAVKFAIKRKANEQKKADESKNNEQKKNNGRKISNSKKLHGGRRFFSIFKK